MDSRRCDAVIFDLHGTLVPWSRDGFRAMLSAMADSLGVGDRDFARVMDEIAEENMTGRFDSVMAEVDYVCRALDVHPDSGSIEHAALLWVDLHQQGYEKPYDGAVTILRQLRTMALKIGLITNCGREAPELWSRSQFAPYVDVEIFSVTEGLLKPDSRMYLSASKRLGVAPERCLYVDDSATYLAGAKDIGMNTLLIRHPGNMVQLKGIDEWTGPKVSHLSEVLSHVRTLFRLPAAETPQRG